MKAVVYGHGQTDRERVGWVVGFGRRERMEGRYCETSGSEPEL